MTTLADLEAGYQKDLIGNPIKKLSLAELEANYQKGSPLQSSIDQMKSAQFPGGPDFFGAASEGIDKPTVKNVAAAAAPIVGDIALTALVPEVKAGGALLRPVLNLLTRAGASAIGGGGGELLGQKIQGQNLDFQKAGEQAALGAAGEIGMSGVMGGAKYLGEKVGRPALNLAGNLGPIGKAMGVYLKDAQKAVKEATTGKALRFLEDLQVLPKEDVGMKVGQALYGKADFKTAYKPFSDAIDNIATNNNGEVLLDDTTQYIGDLLVKFKNNSKSDTEAIKDMVNWLGFTGDARTVAVIKDIMQDGYVGPNDAKYVMANFWKKAYGKTTDKANRWKETLKATFLGDLEKFEPGAKVARETADKTYQAIQGFLRESPAAKRIIEKMNFGKSDQLYFEANPGKVGDIIFSRQPDEIMQLRNAIVTEPGGEEAWKMITLDHIAGIFRSSIKRASDTGKSVVAPAELAEKIYASEPVIRASMPSGEWNRLRKEADFYAGMASKFETIDVNNGFDLIQAWGVLSPKSKEIAQNVIKSGAKAAKATVKGGLHFAGENRNGDTK